MSLLRSAWHAWKRFGQFIGNIVGRVFLTLFHFTIFAPFGIGVRLASDPLQLKKVTASTYWKPLQTHEDDIARARHLA